jgi:histidine ammonia-lyase
VLLERLADLLNRDITPALPGQGSVGASGDLVPLAHIGAVLIGEPDVSVWHGGRPQRWGDVQAQLKIDRFDLAAKEAMALTNGATVIAALGALALHDAQTLLEQAAALTSLAVEAVRGEPAAFDPRVHAVRAHAGQVSVAAAIRRALTGSKRATPDARDVELARSTARERVQDAYSLRCTPQVLGAAWDTWHHADRVIGTELASCTDNPLVFLNGGDAEVLSGGNFHGEQLAFALDFLGIAISEVGNIADRRIYRLINEDMSGGLPQDLSGFGGRALGRTGLMTIQYAAASIVNENKGLATPASIDSIPTSGNQEDHVAMGIWSGKKLRAIIDNTRRILAIEAITVARALAIAAPRLEAFPLAPRTAAYFNAITSIAPEALEFEDQYLSAAIGRVECWLADGALAGTAP